MRAIAARDKPCPGGALTVCPRGGASKARLRLQIRAGSQAPPGAGVAPRSEATMSTRPGTLRHSRTLRSARHSPRHAPAETRTAVVARPASVKRLRAHPTGSHAHQEAACQGRGRRCCAQHGSRCATVHIGPNVAFMSYCLTFREVCTDSSSHPLVLSGTTV